MLPKEGAARQADFLICKYILSCHIAAGVVEESVTIRQNKLYAEIIKLEYET
jgi:hypothetical protein